MPETLRILADFYWRPLRAANRALDHGRFWIAAALALAVTFALTIPLSAQGKLWLASRRSEDGSGLYLPEEFWLAPFRTLGFVALVFVPSAIGILAAWRGLGSFGVAIRRDYVPALVCVLFAWAAAFLPSLAAMYSPDVWVWMAGAAAVFWLFLAVCSLQVLMGVSTGEAIVAASGGMVVSGVALMLYSYSGGGLLYLASPWYLYWGYSLVATDLRMIGSGLRSRQHFRRQLEIATLNPRDADAHYQLGLIYQGRRQFDEAASRFQRAIEIDPREAGAHYQLGRIALEQGRAGEALDRFCTAAEIDERHASNEVWRDMGVACFHLGRESDAIAALTRYAERREYDPEGLYWLGKALAASGSREEASRQFRASIEAAETAPSHRRRAVRAWIGRSRAELKAL